DRRNEVLFFDLRREGVPFEKKFIEFDEETISKIAQTYHNWQQVGFESKYCDIEEFCKSVHIDEIRKKDYSLVPSKFIDFKNIEENFNFDEKMNEIKSELSSLFEQEEVLKKEVVNVFKSLGYEL